MHFLNSKEYSNAVKTLEELLKVKKKLTRKENEEKGFKPGSLAYKGFTLFSKVIRYHLNEQKWVAADDSAHYKEHAALMMKLSTRTNRMARNCKLQPFMLT